MAEYELRKLEIEKDQLRLQQEAENKKREEEAAIAAGQKIVIQIVDPEDVEHPYKAFLKTGEQFKSQFGNMIKRNEEMENELIRYKKKVEQLEKHLAMLEGKSPTQKIGGGARP